MFVSCLTEVSNGGLGLHCKPTHPVAGLMKTKEAVHPRIVALGLPSPPPWAQKPLQNKRRRGRGDAGQFPGLCDASIPPNPRRFSSALALALFLDIRTAPAHGLPFPPFPVRPLCICSTM